MDLGSSAASCRPNLPNVILLGDSITRNYFPQVTKDLGAIANVYLLASSTSVGDARLPQQIAEFAYLQGVSFAVVHFNNGLHGWSCTEAQFKTISDISPSDSGTTRARQAHLVYDQHALMTPHPELYEDAFHFNKAGSAMMSVQAAANHQEGSRRLRALATRSLADHHDVAQLLTTTTFKDTHTEI